MKRRALSQLGAALVVSGVLVISPVLAQPGWASSSAGSGSAVTVTGTGSFSGLSVSVSQTRDLVNQSIEITWSGASPTLPSTGGYAINYVQIMQCWGDDDAGPRREQCQFGGIGGDANAGQNTGSRQITLPSTVVDAAETTYPGPSGQPNVYVPFFAANGEKSEGSESQFFDANTTNEIPYGRTRPDGSGRAFFEAQTGLEAPGLGCGVVQTGETTPHRCWLVIVPRNDKEVDGSQRGSSNTTWLLSSPLSTSNWANRVVVPLDFVTQGAACPLGRAERPTLGTELVSEAIGRWQPALCAGGAQNFGYSVVPDDTARRTLAGTSPGLTFLSRGPTDPEASRGVTYAPVTVSGLGIGFNIESQSSSIAPDEVRLRDGKRFDSLKLTPRLVLKLLTQSYRADAGTPGSIADNPLDLSRDKEFLELNPEFAALRFPSISGALLPLGRSDAIRTLWAYAVSDAEARAFLAGTPDPSGMVINPLYKGLDTAREDLPRRDLACTTIADIPVPLCTLDKVPYSNDYYSGARAAARGDRLSRSVWDGAAQPPSWKKSPPQLVGVRAVLTVTETAAATRFGIPLASLRNAAGEFVGPTPTALQAGVAAMAKDAATGLLVPNPAAARAGAYPLTEVAYAATVPSELTKEEGRDYARLLRYAAVEGQQLGVAPGELPFGYSPLPASLAAQATAAAATIEKQAGVPLPTATPTPTPTPTPKPTVSSEPDGTGVSQPSTDPTVPPATTAPEPSGSAAPTVPTGSPSVKPVAAVIATPVDRAPAGRLAVAAALVLGGVALLVRALLPWVARRNP